MAASKQEKRALQGAVALASLVPILAGAGGALKGAAFFDLAGAAGADSHLRYLSGLLLGIGLAFLFCVPRIERHAERFRLLGAIVVLGGTVRLVAALAHGSASRAVVFSLIMELGVTPAICLWQARIASAPR